jgi:membrane-associated phospholipid phosphatase
MPFARVYAAVHYPLDVVGGAAIGALSSYFVFKVFLPLIEPGPTRLLKLLRKLYLA